MNTQPLSVAFCQYMPVVFSKHRLTFKSYCLKLSKYNLSLCILFAQIAAVCWSFTILISVLFSAVATYCSIDVTVRKIWSLCSRLFKLKKKHLLFVFSPAFGGEALSGLSPRQGRWNSIWASQTSLFRKFRPFGASCPNLSASTTFSKTHKQTRDLHRWIALELI